MRNTEQIQCSLGRVTTTPEKKFGLQGSENSMHRA